MQSTSPFLIKLLPVYCSSSLIRCGFLVSFPHKGGWRKSCLWLNIMVPIQSYPLLTSCRRRFKCKIQIFFLTLPPMSCCFIKKRNKSALMIHFRDTRTFLSQIAANRESHPLLSSNKKLNHFISV